jgi:hypothetical protein
MVAVSWSPFHGRRFMATATPEGGTTSGRRRLHRRDLPEDETRDRADRDRDRPRAAAGAVSVVARCPCCSLRAPRWRCSARNYRIDIMDVIINWHSRSRPRELMTRLGFPRVADNRVSADFWTTLDVSTALHTAFPTGRDIDQVMITKRTDSFTVQRQAALMRFDLSHWDSDR